LSLEAVAFSADPRHRDRTPFARRLAVIFMIMLEQPSSTVSVLRLGVYKRFIDAFSPMDRHR
jgi:hypothetical protein